MSSGSIRLPRCLEMSAGASPEIPPAEGRWNSKASLTSFRRSRLTGHQPVSSSFPVLSSSPVGTAKPAISIPQCIRGGPYVITTRKESHASRSKSRGLQFRNNDDIFSQAAESHMFRGTKKLGLSYRRKIIPLRCPVFRLSKRTNA